MFKFKHKVTGVTVNNCTKDVEITVLLQYLSNFWKILSIPLINCGINLMLTWSANYFLVVGFQANQGSTFMITDTKFYVPFVTLSAQDKIRLLRQVEPGFKRTSN